MACLLGVSLQLVDLPCRQVSTVWLISYAEVSVVVPVLWSPTVRSRYVMLLMGDFCFSVTHLYDS